jgi:hypothetical protein
MLSLRSRFPALAILALVTGLAGINLADEPAAKGKEAPGAVIQLDRVKTLRLGKLLENLHILSELNISDETYARLEDAKDQGRLADRQYSNGLSKILKEARDLPAAERAERLRQYVQNHQEGRNANAETFALQRFGLLSGPQMERLNQLDLQEQGLDAFFANELASALKLTADQQKQIEDIGAAYEAKFRPLLKGPIYTESIVIRSKQPAVVELLKERTAKVEQVLGKEQVEKLADLRGKPFELSRMGRAPGELMDFDLTRSRISPMVQNLLSFDAVRKDLKLTPEEEAGIDAAMAKRQQGILDRGRALQADEQGGEKLSAVQRALRREEQSQDHMLKFQQIEKEYAEDLSKHLKDPHLARLKQINLQRGVKYAVGFGGRDELGLTTDQMQKILSIQSDLRRQEMDLRPPLGIRSPDEMRAEITKRMERRQEIQKKEEAQLLEVLTPEQRQKLKELQGPPFDVSLLEAPRMLPARLAPPAKPPEEKPKDTQ